MRLLLEGVASIPLPCTLALGVPALGLALAAGSRRTRVVAGFTVGAGTMMWARAAGHWSLDADGLLSLAAAALLGGSVVALRRPRQMPAYVDVAVGLGAGAVMGWLWRPCVGVELAVVLNDAQTGDVGALVPLVAFIVGACLPAVLMSALPAAVPAVRRWADHRFAIRLGTGIVVATAALIGLGVYDDVVAELLRRSRF